jgi:hypothetical protein
MKAFAMTFLSLGLVVTSSSSFATPIMSCASKPGQRPAVTASIDITFAPEIGTDLVVTIFGTPVASTHNAKGTFTDQGPVKYEMIGTSISRADNSIFNIVKTNDGFGTYTFDTKWTLDFQGKTFSIVCTTQSSED